MPATDVTSPAHLRELLDAQGYLADEGVSTAAYLSLVMRRPLFCEGDAGVGKTSLAMALAGVLGAPLIRLQCYEGLDAAQALYDWDFPRQLLHLRAAEAVGVHDAEQLEAELYDRRFLVARPLLQALETTPCVLLVDEVDRADDEFEAFLLEVLSDFTISVPELGTIRAETPPGPVEAAAVTGVQVPGREHRLMHPVGGRVDPGSAQRPREADQRRRPVVGRRPAVTHGPSERAHPAAAHSASRPATRSWSSRYFRNAPRLAHALSSDPSARSSTPSATSASVQSIDSATPGGFTRSSPRAARATRPTDSASAAVATGSRRRMIATSRSRSGCSSQW